MAGQEASAAGGGPASVDEERVRKVETRGSEAHRTWSWRRSMVRRRVRVVCGAEVGRVGSWASWAGDGWAL
jgi:hypothetical protein